MVTLHPIHAASRMRGTHGITATIPDRHQTMQSNLIRIAHAVLSLVGPHTHLCAGILQLLEHLEL